MTFGPNYVAVTPSDSTVFAPAVTAIFVGSSGNVAVLGLNDTAAVTMVSPTVGVWHKLPYPIQKIMATNTSAGSILACQTG